MSGQIHRREFLELTAGGALCWAGAGLFAGRARAVGTKLISPGCRRSKVKVARIYMGPKRALWPKPSMNIQEEIASYGKRFDKLGAELADVDFPVNSLVSSAAEVSQIADKLKDVDGILVIHLTMGTGGILQALAASGKPVAVFAAP
jgi:hypothetical protein